MHFNLPDSIQACHGSSMYRVPHDREQQRGACPGIPDLRKSTGNRRFPLGSYLEALRSRTGGFAQRGGQPLRQGTAGSSARSRSYPGRYGARLWLWPQLHRVWPQGRLPAANRGHRPRQRNQPLGARPGPLTPTPSRDAEKQRHLSTAPLASIILCTNSPVACRSAAGRYASLIGTVKADPTGRRSLKGLCTSAPYREVGPLHNERRGTFTVPSAGPHPLHDNAPAR